MVDTLSEIESQSRFETAKIEDEIERDFAKFERMNANLDHEIDELSGLRTKNDDLIEETKQKAGIYANGLFVNKRDELKAKAAATRIKHILAKKCGINLSSKDRLNLNAIDAVTGYHRIITINIIFVVLVF